MDPVIEAIGPSPARGRPGSSRRPRGAACVGEEAALGEHLPRPERSPEAGRSDERGTISSGMDSPHGFERWRPPRGSATGAIVQPTTVCGSWKEPGGVTEIGPTRVSASIASGPSSRGRLSRASGRDKMRVDPSRHPARRPSAGISTGHASFPGFEGRIDPRVPARHQIRCSRPRTRRPGGAGPSHRRRLAAPPPCA